MPSKISSYNKELILQIGRSTGWISIVYFLGLLFFLPIRILMIYSDENLMKNYYPDNLFRYDFEFQIGLMAIVPVILAVFLFRFLHVKQSVDLIHSLPLKRSRIFHHYALTGLVFLVLPVAAIAIILLIQHASLDISHLFTVNEVFYWAGTTIIITLLLYAASMFVAMMTGISIVHAVLAYIFLLFPAGFALILFYNLKFLLFGFPADYFLNQQLEKLSPITYAAVLDGKNFEWQDTVIYLVLTFILYGVSLFFYKNRKLESASEAIAYPKLRSIFQYGVAFCTMLLGGSYFREISFNSWGWTIFGYVIGAVVGYFVAAMVLNKTWRVFGQVKGLCIYLVLMAVFVLGIHTLGIYQNRVPKQADISNVLLTDSMTSYGSFAAGSQEDFSPKPLKGKANIAAVLKLHQQMIKDRSLIEDRVNDRTTTFFIRYELKNGHHITREYSVNQRLYDDFFKPIYESEEYNLATKEIFKIKDNKIKSINISANGPVGKAITLSEPNEVIEAVAALRKDVLAENYDDSLYYNGRGSMIDIYISRDQFIHLEMRPNYVNFINWLKEKDLLNRVNITADDIEYILVAKGEYAKTDNLDVEDLKRKLENSPDTMKVTDKGQIERILNSSGTDSSMEYTALICYKLRDVTEVLFLDKEHAPDFVLNHF